MMFGTWLAVAYAVPRQVADTVCAKTSWRPKPTMFDTMVIAPMSTAARPMAAPACGPPSVCCARPALIAASCASVTGGWESSSARQADAGRCDRPCGPAPGRLAPGRLAPAGPGRRARPSGPGPSGPGSSCWPLVTPPPGRPGPPAEHVYPVQRRGPLDELGEADLLAGRGQRDDSGQHGHPAGPGQGRGGRGAEHGPEGVGPRVAQHGPLPEILAHQGEGRAQREPGQRDRRHGLGFSQHRTSQRRTSHRRTSHRRTSQPGTSQPGTSQHGALPVRARPARGGQQAARQRRDLDGSPGPQVEQVEQVGASRDEARVHRDVQRAAAQQRARGQPGGTDAADLDRAGGHLTVAQGAQVTAETPPVAAAREVVVAAEAAGPGHGGHQRSPGPARQARGEGGGERGPGGGRGSFQQGDRLAAVVGPGPGRGPARRARPE